MNTFFPGPLSDHSRNIMRRLGYGEQRTRQGQISYVKRIIGERFPRFHAYVEDTNGGIQINLHIDQKEASHEGTSAHAGEYGGRLVEQEMQRISALLKEPVSAPAVPVHESDAKKSGFFSRFFG